MSNTWTPEYAPWRHGGWYVTNVHYPRGAVGCVSRNYSDGKWRIACSEAYPGSPTDRTFRTRDDAARAERELASVARMLYGDSVDEQLPQDIYETEDEYADAREDLGPDASTDTVLWLVEQRAAIAASEYEPVNVPAHPVAHPQPYDMPSPEADALDRIADLWGGPRPDTLALRAIAVILRETGRLASVFDPESS